jgi:hypothetical protein
MGTAAKCRMDGEERVERASTKRVGLKNLDSVHARTCTR